MKREIEALESYWRGTVFRSRTEARWAAFFTFMGIRWEYEPEGFLLPSDDRYLPDFWLHGMRVWVDVKPSVGPKRRARQKAHDLVLASGVPLLFLPGAPEQRAYKLLCREEHEGEARVVEWPVCWHGTHCGRDEPRMFFTPATSDLTDCDEVARAMRRARNIDFSDPSAGDYLPAGWTASDVADPWDDEGALRGEDDAEAGAAA